MDKMDKEKRRNGIEVSLYISFGYYILLFVIYVKN